MKFLLLLALTASFGFAHKNCCDHKERKWSSDLSLSATNTSSSFYPTNHHQGLSLDHSSISVNGPAGDYLDTSAALAFHTSKKKESRKTILDFEVEELSLKTTKKVHETFGAKIGRFASYISPANQEHCCGTYFIKRPILYRAFLGGHLIDNGAHIEYKINHSNKSQTTLGFENFQGKGLMPKTNRSIGLLAWMLRHKKNINKNHSLDLSFSYVLNTLYNQNRTNTSDHVGCCQGGSYTGKHMIMGNLDLISHLNNTMDCTFSLEMARVSKLATRFEKKGHHLAYNAGPVVSFKDLSVGTIEVGIRYDYLRGISFCPHDGPYLTKTIEKTAMLGWKPCANQTFRFEYTNQTLKSMPQNHIFQIKYTVTVSIF